MSAVVTGDGHLKLPLYHGTSIYYWPSIQSHGLGGINIVEAWRLIPLLEDALTILRAVRHPDVQNEVRLRLPLLETMAAQRVSGGGFNFRHGSVYVTLCAWKAVSYGGRGFGSELVGQVAETLDLLARTRPDAEANLLSKYPELAEARSAEHRPVLIRLDNVHISRLRGENGDDPERAIKLAESFVGHGDSGPQVAFELIGGAEPTELSASEVEVTDWGYGFPRAWTSRSLD
jgi:hypothetical protein